MSYNNLPSEIQTVIYNDFINLFKIDHVSKYKKCLEMIPSKRYEFITNVYISYHSACRNGDIKTLKTLIDTGYKYHAPASFISNNGLLELLIKFGNMECMEFVLNTPLCNMFSDAIQYCLKYDNPDALDLLILHGFSIESHHMIEAIENDCLNIMTYLVYKGYKPDIKTALQCGCFKTVIFGMEMFMDPTEDLIHIGNIIGSRSRFFDGIYVACCNRDFISLYTFSEGFDHINNVLCVSQNQIESCSQLHSLKSKKRQMNNHLLL